MADQSISPQTRGGAANKPVSPDSQAPAVAALRATEVGCPQAEARLPRLRAASAAIRLSRASHDFGEVCVGEDEYWLLALHNEAEKEGIISDISGLPSEGFSLFEPPTLPFTLPPHGSWIIIVRYAPDLAGNKSVAALSITTNDPHFPVQKVLLTGAGVTAPQHEVRCTLGKGTECTEPAAGPLSDDQNRAFSAAAAGEAGEQRPALIRNGASSQKLPTSRTDHGLFPRGETRFRPRPDGQSSVIFPKAFAKNPCHGWFLNPPKSP